MAVIIVMTNIWHIQNPLSKQHLNGCHHFRSIVWVNANICYHVIMILTIQFERKDMALTFTRNFKVSSCPLRPGRNYVVVLCNDFMGNLLTLFCTMCNSVKIPCDIKSFKVSTAYDVWFSRYRHSNLMLATDSALVLVFINTLWALYIYRIMYVLAWLTVYPFTRGLFGCK